ncbi:MAG: hypothetical protein D6765_12165, partial [Bacteroidetes bacterium]
VFQGGDTLFGVEWIEPEWSYWRLEVDEDGMYRIPFSQLQEAGFPLEGVEGRLLRLYHLGREVPIYLSSEGELGPNDFLEFFGWKNRSELDSSLFADPAVMMNPRFSLFTDTSAYFLALSDAPGGRRFQAVPNEPGGAQQAFPFVEVEVEEVFSNSFDKERTPQNLRFSTFETGEGYASDYASEHVFTLQPPSPHPGGGEGVLRLRVGTTIGGHTLEVTLAGTPVFSEDFANYAVREIVVPVSPSMLQAPLELRVRSLGGGSDRSRVAYWRLRYARQPDFGDLPYLLFRLPAAAEPRLLEIENAPAGEPPLFYDLTHALRLEGRIDGGKVQLVLPPAGEERRVAMVQPQSGFRTPAGLAQVNFPDWNQWSGDYLILTHAALRAGEDPVQAYADYRASAQGGGYRPLILEVETLYDLFAYGVRRHPLALRNCIQFLRSRGDSLKQVFLVGKGREYPSVRFDGQLHDPGALPLLVPTFGLPGSDNLLTAFGREDVPLVAVGRLPANGPADVRLYLEKVRRFEANHALPQTLADRAWMKRVLHFGGGVSLGEQQTIKNSLAQMGQIVEGPHFGGQVHSFFKTSTDPIQISKSELIFELINGGVSLMTVFGHSGVGTFDFSVDNPEAYENFGRYPLVVSLGCYSGNIHTSFRGISENFVLQDGKGAIAMGAASSLGFISDLRTYASAFYQNLSELRYGQTLGEQLCATARSFAASPTFIRALSHQFTLNGDPALRLNPHPGPDYVLDPAGIRTEPAVISAQDASFELHFRVVNLGRAEKDSATVEVRQRLPDGDVFVVGSVRIALPFFQGEYSLSLPVLGKRAAGVNQFTLHLDYLDEVEERPAPAAEQNNLLSFPLFIADNSARPVWPPEFAIVGDAPLRLLAATSDPLAPARAYHFQVDTTARFDSPLLQSATLQQSGGLMEWKPPVNAVPGRVYFWRVSPDSSAFPTGAPWAESSFLYLPDSSGGWNQSHFFQFLRNELTNFQLEEPSRRLRFADDVRDVEVRNFVPNSIYPSLHVDNRQIEFYPGFDVNGGVYIAVLEERTLTPWVNPLCGAYGSETSCGWRPRNAFGFRTDAPDQRKEVMDFLDTIVPAGAYVVLFTVQKSNTSYLPEDWAGDSLLFGKNLFQLLENQGAQLIRRTAVEGAKPYVFIFQKDRGVLAERLADSLFQRIDVKTTVTGNWDEGFLWTPPLGPARSYERLEWSVEESDPPGTDVFGLEVYGVRGEGLADTLLMKLNADTVLSLQGLPAERFPRLRLRFSARDSARTAPDLRILRVFYEGLPDAALNPAAHFLFPADTLEQGQPLHLEVAIENPTPYALDSLLAAVRVFQGQVLKKERLVRLAPLAPGERLNAAFEMPTQDLLGPLTLALELNPNADQPELHRFNNFLQHDFFVRGDGRNPLLDVTFDGRHIFEGELVGPRPEIAIALRDDNEYLLLDDTTHLRIFLQRPGQALADPIPYTHPAVS